MSHHQIKNSLIVGISFALVACSRPATPNPSLENTLKNTLEEEDGIADVDDRCPILVGCFENEWMDMDGCPDAAIAFAVGSSFLDKRAQRALDTIVTEIARLGARLGGLRVMDGRSQNEPVVLATERLSKVRTYLMAAGVDSDLIRTDKSGYVVSAPQISFDVEQCETTTPRSDWWTGAGACPDGSRPVGIDGVQVYCETGHGTRHGRFNWWHGQQLFYEGEYSHGKRHGTWIVWRDGARIATARYRHGRLAKDAPLWSPEQKRLACAGQRAGPDCDRDGVPATRDLCLTLPEDRDGFMDDDGCPEPDVDDACPVESARCHPGG